MMESISLRRPVLAVSLLVVIGGCYSYEPVRPERVAPGTAVRVRITSEEAARLSDVLPTGARVLDGEFVDRTGAGLTLTVPSAVIDQRRGVTRLHQRIDLPAGEVLGLERRRLDGLKTAAAVGAGAVAVGLIAAFAFDSDGGTKGAPKPNPDDVRIPLIRLRFGGF